MKTEHTQANPIQAEPSKFLQVIGAALELAAVAAVYKGELPSAATGRILLDLDDFLPNAVINAFKSAIASEELIKKYEHTKLDPVDDIMSRVVKLSEQAADFASDFSTVQKDQVLEATMKTSQLKDLLNKKDISMEGIMQHFDIPMNTTPVIDTQQQVSKDQKMGM